MSKLKKNREKLNLTQEELAERSGISVRTLQRIEAGVEPKGHTLKALAKALEVEESDLLHPKAEPKPFNLLLLKLINLSSLPVCFIPPLNILFPFMIVFAKKQFNPITKQIISIQLLWTILSVILFMISSFMKNWFFLSNKFSLVVMIVLVLINVFIILRNAIEIDKNKGLYIKLNFSLI